MSAYRRKSIPVEAIQWGGTNVREVGAFLRRGPEEIDKMVSRTTQFGYMDKLVVNTQRDGNVNVDRQQWIVRDELGLTVIDDRWFKEQYEVA